jgi:predicted N-acetyltransferase YhbS
MTATALIRSMRASDVPELAAVLARAYQTDQNFEWRLGSYLRMRAVATFVAECDGKPVGMVVGNDYGPSAYVSQMAVDPVLQRRKIGSALMDALIAWCDARGFAGIELDATPSGAPLYARHGFVAVGETRLYTATRAGGDARAARRYLAADRDGVLAADADAFGADRSDVIRLLLDEPQNAAFVIGGGRRNVSGYAVAQPITGLLGPVIAPAPNAAAQLIDAARAHLSIAHRIAFPSDNAAAGPILTARGYRCQHSLAHMVRGARPAAAQLKFYARINLGQG